MTTDERLAVLETKVEAQIATTREIKDKLDELLHLRSRGMGIFWLTSSLVGTGIIGAFLSFVDWFRGAGH